MKGSSKNTKVESLEIDILGKKYLIFWVWFFFFIFTTVKSGLLKFEIIFDAFSL